MGVDVNRFACLGTGETVKIAELAKPDADGKDSGSGRAEGETREKKTGHGHYLGNILSDLGTSFRHHQVDVLVFNPPYVPTPALLPSTSLSAINSKSESQFTSEASLVSNIKTTFEDESKLLELSYAGGKDGMEITDRLLEQVPEVLSERGVAYILLCRQNKPDEVVEKIQEWNVGDGKRIWKADVVGRSGKVGGWEKLVILRIWRESIV